MSHLKAFNVSSSCSSPKIFYCFPIFYSAGNFISRFERSSWSWTTSSRVGVRVKIIRTMSTPSAFRAKTNTMKTWRPKNPPSVRRSKCVCIASNIQHKYDVRTYAMTSLHLEPRATHCIANRNLIVSLDCLRCNICLQCCSCVHRLLIMPTLSLSLLHSLSL